VRLPPLDVHTLSPSYSFKHESRHCCEGILQMPEDCPMSMDNHVNPLQAESFLLLITEDDVRETHSG
jgi:hypothetical protein